MLKSCLRLRGIPLILVYYTKYHPILQKLIDVCQEMFVRKMTPNQRSHFYAILLSVHT